MKTYIKSNYRIIGVLLDIMLLFVIDVVQAQTPAVADPAASSGEKLPIGTVVSELPGACEPTPVDNVQYYHCGANYYRVAYQGNNLVYVTTDLPK